MPPFIQWPTYRLYQVLFSWPMWAFTKAKVKLHMGFHIYTVYMLPNYVIYAYVYSGQTMDNLHGNLCAYQTELILYDTFIYGFGHIPWKFNFAVRLVLLVSQCCLLCVESFLVSIKISPGFLEELPDCDEPTQVKALWYHPFLSSYHHYRSKLFALGGTLVLNIEQVPCSGGPPPLPQCLNSVMS